MSVHQGLYSNQNKIGQFAAGGLNAWYDEGGCVRGCDAIIAGQVTINGTPDGNPSLDLALHANLFISQGIQCWETGVGTIK